MLEERRVVEVKGAGSMLQTLMCLASRDQVSALRPAPSCRAWERNVLVGSLFVT